MRRVITIISLLGFVILSGIYVSQPYGEWVLENIRVAYYSKAFLTWMSTNNIPFEQYGFLMIVLLLTATSMLIYAMGKHNVLLRRKNKTLKEDLKKANEMSKPAKDLEEEARKQAKAEAKKREESFEDKLTRVEDEVEALRIALNVMIAVEFEDTQKDENRLHDVRGTLQKIRGQYDSHLSLRTVDLVVAEIHSLIASSKSDSKSDRPAENTQILSDRITMLETQIKTLINSVHECLQAILKLQGKMVEELELPEESVPQAHPLPRAAE